MYRANEALSNLGKLNWHIFNSDRWPCETCHISDMHTLIFSHCMSVNVEGLYCKRPIQCLASSEILTPHPLTFGAGGGHTRWVERWWVVNSSEDASHCSVLYICKYFVVCKPKIGSREVIWRWGTISIRVVFVLRRSPSSTFLVSNKEYSGWLMNGTLLYRLYL